MDDRYSPCYLRWMDIFEGDRQDRLAARYHRHRLHSGRHQGCEEQEVTVSRRESPQITNKSQ